VIPSIGRIVLFAFYQDRARTVLVERPAIITSIVEGTTINVSVFFEVSDDIVGLVSSDDNGTIERRSRDPRIEFVLENHSDAPVAGRWRWPPRV
jgi:hypothetical protein